MPTPKKGSILLDQARIGLARLWLFGSGLIASILIAQSVAGKYEGVVQDVWSWALPSIIPTLSLILAVLGANALGKEKKQNRVQRTFYTITFWLSASYLVLILSTLAVEPLVALDAPSLYKLSNLWLAPFQGFVTSSMGVLFFTCESAAAGDKAGVSEGIS